MILDCFWKYLCIECKNPFSQLQLSQNLKVFVCLPIHLPLCLFSFLRQISQAHTFILYTVLTHHQGGVLSQKKLPAPLTSCYIEKWPKIDQKWVFIKFVGVIYGKLMERRLQRVKKVTDLPSNLTNFMPHEKLVPGTKVTQNESSLSMVESYMVEKPMKRRF